MIKYIALISLVVILIGCTVEDPDVLDPRDQTIKDLRSRITILEDQIAKKVHCDVADNCPVCNKCPTCETCPEVDCSISESNLIYRARISYNRAEEIQNKAEDSMEEFEEEYDDEDHTNCPDTNDEIVDYLFDASAFYQKAQVEFALINGSEHAGYYVDAIKYRVLANEDLSDWYASYRESCRRGDFDYMDEDDDEYEDYKKNMRSYTKVMLKIDIMEDVS